MSQFLSTKGLPVTELGRVLSPAMARKKIGKESLAKMLALHQEEFRAIWEFRVMPTEDILRQMAIILDLDFEMLSQVAYYRPSFASKQRDGRHHGTVW